jgi:hypothetical protein
LNRNALQPSEGRLLTVAKSKEDRVASAKKDVQKHPKVDQTALHVFLAHHRAATIFSQMQTVRFQMMPIRHYERFKQHAAAAPEASKPLQIEVGQVFHVFLGDRFLVQYNGADLEKNRKKKKDEKKREQRQSI